MCDTGLELSITKLPENVTDLSRMYHVNMFYKTINSLYLNYLK